MATPPEFNLLEKVTAVVNGVEGKKLPVALATHEDVLSEQEDLLVWMRTAALPTFRKLYGRIETELQPNDKITVTIQNNYNTYSFEGKKRLVISTTTWMGGKNDFLGRVYITAGGLCIFLAIAFMAIYLIKPRPLGDPSYLSWNKNQQFL